MLRRTHQRPIGVVAFLTFILANGFSTALAAPLTATEQSATRVPAGYTLVWADEFDGDQLATEHWLYRTTRRGKTSICRPENVSVSDGKLQIALKREEFNGAALTCGGIITKQQYKYGYFEVACKIDGGQGWHEAFWTTDKTNFNYSKTERQQPRIEIDCFEQYALHDTHQFTYGVIEWHPTRGSVCREVVKTKSDLSQDFHVYGFEFTPDYIAFYFDGELLSTHDMRQTPHNRHHLWLTCIGTENSDQVKPGVCYFDYFRAYEIDFQSPTYEQRRWQFVNSAANGAGSSAIASAGVDLWIEAENFAQKAGWTVERDGQRKVLIAHKKHNPKATWEQLVAQTIVNVATPGQYRLWVSARDYAENAPGKRRFDVAVNGDTSKTHFGTHHQEGYAWQDGGVFSLPAGPTTLELIDSAQFFARCDKLLLTTDLEFQPPARGGAENVTHTFQASQLKSARP